MKARTQRIAATLGVALLALGCDIDIDITDTGADSAEGDGANDDGMEEGGSEEGTEEGGSEVDGGEDEGGEESDGGEASDGGGDADCCEPHQGSGCDDDVCAQSVCEIDPFCCDLAWDEVCVQTAQASDACACEPGGSDDGGSGGDSGGLEDDCHPLAQDCPDGEACYPYEDGGICAPIAEQGQPGDVCEFVNVCDIGSVCANGGALEECGGAGCCVSLCDLVDPLCDDPEATCQPYYEEGTAPPGHEDVGLCLL